MFWDGSRWVDETPTPSHRPEPSHRIRDWLATAAMFLVLATLLVPFVATSAASAPARRLISDWSQTNVVRTFQETSTRITYQGRWTRANYPDYLGTAVRFAQGRGATATIRFTGTGISWIGPVGPTRGKAKLYLDGHLVKTVDTYARHFKPAQILYEQTFAVAEPRTLTISVTGTSGHPTVAIDAFVVRGKKGLAKGRITVPPPVPGTSPDPNRLVPSDPPSPSPVASTTPVDPRPLPRRQPLLPHPRPLRRRRQRPRRRRPRRRRPRPHRRRLRFRRPRPRRFRPPRPRLFPHPRRLPRRRRRRHPRRRSHAARSRR